MLCYVMLCYDYHNSFTAGKSVKFATKQYINYTPHLKYTAALPRETVALEFRHFRHHCSANMVFSDEDKILIKNLHLLKGYKVKKLSVMNEFPNNGGQKLALTGC